MNLLKLWFSPPLSAKAEQDAQHDWLEIQQYFVRNFHRQELSLLKVEEETGILSSRLSDVIYHHTHLSPKKYLESLRMEHATRLLKEGSHTIEEVAAAVGYKDPTSFYKVFKMQHRKSAA